MCFHAPEQLLNAYSLLVKFSPQNVWYLSKNKGKGLGMILNELSCNFIKDFALISVRFRSVRFCEATA